MDIKTSIMVFAAMLLTACVSSQQHRVSTNEQHTTAVAAAHEELYDDEEEYEVELPALAKLDYGKAPFKAGSCVYTAAEFEQCIGRWYEYSAVDWEGVCRGKTVSSRWYKSYDQSAGENHIGVEDSAVWRSLQLAKAQFHSDNMRLREGCTEEVAAALDHTERAFNGVFGVYMKEDYYARAFVDAYLEVMPRTIDKLVKSLPSSDSCRCMGEIYKNICGWFDYSRVDWAKMETLYYVPYLGDWPDEYEVYVGRDHDSSADAQFWNMLQNARVRFHIQNMVLRVGAPRQTLAALNRTEASFDSVFVRYMRSDYTATAQRRAYDEVMPGEINRLIRSIQ